MNSKMLNDSFIEYEKEIKNCIIGEFNIELKDVGDNIRIINSFENFISEYNYLSNDNEYKKNSWKYENEKEIKDNIEIKINGKIIDFSYYHKFEKEGKYEIEYSFKNNLTNIN